MIPNYSISNHSKKCGQIENNSNPAFFLLFVLKTGIIQSNIVKSSYHCCDGHNIVDIRELLITRHACQNNNMLIHPYLTS